MEDVLAQYGVLGLWTLSLIYEKYNSTRTMKKAIDNNTVATNRLSSIIEIKKL